MISDIDNDDSRGQWFSSCLYPKCLYINQLFLIDKYIFFSTRDILSDVLGTTLSKHWEKILLSSLGIKLVILSYSIGLPATLSKLLTSVAGRSTLVFYSAQNGTNSIFQGIPQGVPTHLFFQKVVSCMKYAQIWWLPAIAMSSTPESSTARSHGEERRCSNPTPPPTFSSPCDPSPTTVSTTPNFRSTWQNIQS